ncbi:MAG: endonuclease/exonuclease/phosphatase family protein [Chitinophagales bacterium]|nr:endonuclease/exonuclease/phosphatase family protein [Chitinophagales bacterium]
MLNLIIILVLLFGFYVLAMILFNWATDYRPGDTTAVQTKNQGIPIDTVAEKSFLIWNIGFGGLGEEMDFFYDGGKSVRPKKVLVEKYLEGIHSFLEGKKNLDFILLQEVDKRSKRSYRNNEVESISNIFENHSSAFAPNYKVKYIPIPFEKPLGGVLSGLLSLSKFQADEVTRYQFPGNFSFPKSLFFLDRCYLKMRYKLPDGKELIVINTHNSAYDDGSLKKIQMEYMRADILNEYQEGNYVIVGGDWNQCPPNFDCYKFKKAESPYEQRNIEEDYLPGWTWGYDSEVPTNRKLAKPYDPETTFTTVIDFYLCSPNIEITKIKTHDLDFAYSDHQPVELHVLLK